MKIAVLSDIHANFNALMQVNKHIRAWKPNITIVNGDIINRGPQPLECLEFVKGKIFSEGWVVCRGNHEDYIVQLIKHPPNRKTEIAFHRAALWTAKRLEGEFEFLTSLLQGCQIFTSEGSEVRVLHASMQNNRDGIYPETSDINILSKIDPPPAVFVTSHTHRPLIRSLNDSIIINSGSVGLPFDGDQRAAYAQVYLKNGHWKSRVIRVTYDYSTTEEAYRSPEFIASIGPLAYLLLEEHLRAQSLMYGWVQNYKEKILNGEVSLKVSIQEYLDNI